MRIAPQHLDDLVLRSSLRLSASVLPSGIRSRILRTRCTCSGPPNSDFPAQLHPAGTPSCISRTRCISSGHTSHPVRSAAIPDYSTTGRRADSPSRTRSIESRAVIYRKSAGYQIRHPSPGNLQLPRYFTSCSLRFFSLIRTPSPYVR